MMDTSAVAINRKPDRMGEQGLESPDGQGTIMLGMRHLGVQQDVSPCITDASLYKNLHETNLREGSKNRI
jgi:hypothetical protein